MFRVDFENGFGKLRTIAKASTRQDVFVCIQNNLFS